MQNSRLDLKLLIFLCISFLSGELYAQLNATTIGDAVDLGGNCYRITPDLLNQSGGVWYDNPIDFDEDFTIYYQNNFGSKDVNGADGMALVFKRDVTPLIGGLGGGLGYQGIAESLIVEFDTFQNNSPDIGVLADPTFDHIAIQRDGNPFHNNTAANLAGPIQASAMNPNIEDGVDHEIKIQWNATTQIFNVYFDCALRLSLNLDIKTWIFSGDDSVFFGFVGSTGGLSNLHQVCFNNITFVDNLLFEDQDICLGDSYNVDATVPSGDTYSWTPTTGVSDPNIANPVLSPTVTTTYTVTISDNCGETTTEDITINVLPTETPIFDSINPICEGENLAPLPTTSNNGISGTWSPALDNTTTTIYTFTPDNNSCASETTLEIIVNSNIFPTFDAIGPICEGENLAPLPTTSNNGITGTWSPALDNTTTTTYTFIPNAAQGCVLVTTLEIVVNPYITATFDVIGPICEGETLAPLPTTSNNGIIGSWSPMLDNTITTTYTFTPDAGQGCVLVTTLEIIVNPNTTPLFDAVNPICEGQNLAPLPTTSNNGITGSWSPVLDNTITTTYTFTPDTGQGCVSDATLEIIVNPNAIPLFDVVNPICEGGALAPLPTISNNGITGSWIPALDNTITTVYTFTPDAGQGCVLETSLEIIVHPLPTVVVPTVLEVCDDGVPDGFTEIDLSIKNTEITGNNPNYMVSYYLTPADAEAGLAPLPIPYTNTSNCQTVFVRVEDIVTGCYDTTALELCVEQAPVANVPEPLRYCDPDNDGFGMFPLDDADNEITGGAPGLTVTYHETFANADNNVDAIDTSVDYNNIVVDAQTLYARVESATIATDCATIVE
uniref:L-type lectin-domain containing protein n=1 Tax=Winogradskyella sp. TaxID=1883156 RepID=UPI0026072882